MLQSNVIYCRPQHVIILGDKGSDIAALLRAAIPDLDVQVGGAKPQGRYALIAFTPGPEIARYADAQWVHIAGAGANTVLDRLAEANMRPRLITRSLGRMGEQIGEYVLSYVLADTQKHEERRRLQAERRWDVPAGTPDLASDRTALILGTGGIGQGVADALQAVSIRVWGASRSGREADGFDRNYRLDELPDLADVDIVVGALPLTPDTHSIIASEFFARLKNALFINVGRGATADMDALTAALRSGALRHAVLDVVPREPLPEDSPLWTNPDITITPHVSGITLNEDTVAAFVAAYRAIKVGDEPPLQVDPAAGY